MSYKMAKKTETEQEKTNAADAEQFGSEGSKVC